MVNVNIALWCHAGYGPGFFRGLTLCVTGGPSTTSAFGEACVCDIGTEFTHFWPMEIEVFAVTCA